jgi:hypothetical protein
MSVARKQIPKTQQWISWETVFSTRSVRQLRDSTIKAFLEAVISMRSLSRSDKQDKSSI